MNALGLLARFAGCLIHGRGSEGGEAPPQHRLLMSDESIDYEGPNANLNALPRLVPAAMSSYRILAVFALIPLLGGVYAVWKTYAEHSYSSRAVQRMEAAYQEAAIQR